MTTIVDVDCYRYTMSMSISPKYISITYRLTQIKIRFKGIYFEHSN